MESCIFYTADHDWNRALRLYYPKDFTNGLLPTVIDIHGGGWMYGDKDLNRNYCMYLASKGYAVMGMGYRLVPEVNLKQMLGDINDSLLWLKKFGAGRGFDLDHVLLTGDSAGAHLSYLTIVAENSETVRSAYGLKKTGLGFCALALSHVSCTLSPVENTTGHAQVAPLLTRGCPEIQDYICFDQVEPLSKFPPVFVIGSENDQFKKESLDLIDYLDRKGIRHETLFWDDRDATHLVHVFNISFWDMQESMETNNRMLSFFNRCIG